MRHYLDGLAAQPCVYYALVDLMQYGRDALDLGAWQGDMSIIMSRLSGPRGQIVAVEASRKYAEVCQRHLVENGCPNVFLINRAVWSASEGNISFREDARWPQGGRVCEPSSITDDPNVKLQSVKTVCVDDLVSDFNLRPYLIKADLEGGERAMIEGARKTIETYRPILILEQDQHQVDVADRLIDTHCYTAVCLENYQQIYEPSAFYSLYPGFNAAFIPQEAFARSPYGDLSRVHSLIAPDGLCTANLLPGRYVIRAPEDIRPSLRQMPYSRGLNLLVCIAGKPVYETLTLGSDLTLGHPFALISPAEITIALTASEEIGRDIIGMISSLTLERVGGSISSLTTRYNDLIVPQ